MKYFNWYTAPLVKKIKLKARLSRLNKLRKLMTWNIWMLISHLKYYL